MNRRKFIEDIGLGSAFAWVACKFKAASSRKPIAALDAAYSAHRKDRIVITLDEFPGFEFSDPHPMRYELVDGQIKRVDKPIA